MCRFVAVERAVCEENKPENQGNTQQRWVGDSFRFRLLGLRLRQVSLGSARACSPQPVRQPPYCLVASATANQFPLAGVGVPNSSMLGGDPGEVKPDPRRDGAKALPVIAPRIGVARRSPLP